MRIQPVVLALLILTACAAEVPRTPTNFVSQSAPDNVLRIKDAITIDSGNAYPSKMPAHSQWRQIGSIPEGDVFKIQNDVFTVTGRHVHEACIVVKGKEIVGFYLPVEKAFTPVSKKVLLPL